VIEGVSKGLVGIAGALLGKLGPKVVLRGVSGVVGKDVPACGVVGSGISGRLVELAGVMPGKPGTAVVLTGAREVMGMDVPG
jgi:hypothetical protein